MIIFHAGFDFSQLLLWAETPAEFTSVSTKRAGRRSVTSPPLLPYDTGAAGLLAALPKRLGNFPFWRGAARFLDAVEPSYQRASARGLATFLGEKQSEENLPSSPPVSPALLARERWKKRS